MASQKVIGAIVGGVVLLGALIAVIVVFAGGSAVTTTAATTTTAAATTTTSLTGATISQALNNLCQPGGSASFLVGDEDFSVPDQPGPQPGHFAFFSPNYFASDGTHDFDPYSTTIDASDCTITLTPKNAGEKIIIETGHISMNENASNAIVITELTTDMTTCGDKYFSINGIKKCGSVGPSFNHIEFDGPVELKLKADATVQADIFFAFYTGTQATPPTYPNGPTYTTPGYPYYPYGPGYNSTGYPYYYPYGPGYNSTGYPWMTTPGY